MESKDKSERSESTKTFTLKTHIQIFIVFFSIVYRIQLISTFYIIFLYFLYLKYHNSTLHH